ncbi:NADH-ubiquinone oxidoreductase-F iron-sulfur binding region domain-containing protein [Nakamurella lactea]|uniref:NADH-ubiquinone oxidoreductase-F iron-sulfur binding region domain-containing protein n=1 Tax=Nakamurella lactea TaxID=459515 RepID=UPI00042407B8|nr:NADH-ubiquinone oxidoreductase-F iron-sulfur binding region domain-containing protein [Nakamurella lactea]
MTVVTPADLRPVVAAFPGAEGRLLAGPDGSDLPESLAGYAGRGGYRELADPDGLFDQVRTLDLRGRGGAAFPLHRKLSGVRDEVALGSGPAVVVANGEEGEPASIKDRWLLRHRPHLVLDGLRLAAALVDAATRYVYLSDPAAADAVGHALAELTDDPPIRVIQVDPGYVAGEETAVVRAIDGGPALPTDKPPRPYQEGVDGRPTLVSNVETLAQLALIHRIGADAYAAVGTATSPGTLLVTMAGRTAPGLFEVPFGVTVRDLLYWRGEDPSTVTGVLMGGFFTGVTGPALLDVPLDPSALRAAGSGLGCGAVALLGPTDCPVVLTAQLMAYFARENAGQCGSCFNGTAAMSAVLSALAAGEADASNLDRLAYWSGFLTGRGACGTLDAATNIARTLLAEHPKAVQQHLSGHCDGCGPAGSVTVTPDAAAPFAAVL